MNSNIISQIVDDIFKVSKNINIKTTKILKKESEILKKVKKLPLRRNDATLNSAILQAGGYAKKHNKVYFVYQGNSYMNLVYQVTYKKNDALNPINNTGGKIFEVNSDLEIKEHILDR